MTDDAQRRSYAETGTGFPLTQNLAFGTGPHVCPGASLARLETVVVLETLWDRVANFALVDEFVPVPNPVFWALGHRALPVTLKPLSACNTQ